MTVAEPNLIHVLDSPDKPVDLSLMYPAPYISVTGTGTIYLSVLIPNLICCRPTDPNLRPMLDIHWSGREERGRPCFCACGNVYLLESLSSACDLCGCKSDAPEWIVFSEGDC